MFNLFKKKDEQKAKVITFYAPVSGELIKLEDVNDLVFAEKMMGEGFAVRPSDNRISSPVAGKVTNVFPTQHALGILISDLEVLLHMGIDTVSLDGKPFDTKVKENESIDAETIVSVVDLDQIKESGKDTDMVVIFTNSNEVVESFDITEFGQVERGQEIGKVYLK